MVNSVPIARTRFSNARWLIVAPHPDDEILGAAALMADAHGRGCFAGTVFLTDGSGSHAHRDETSRRRLVDARRQEARLAQRRLIGAGATSPIFFNWADAHPFRSDENAFAAAAKVLGALCRQRRVDAIAVTASAEPHCDHIAANLLANAGAQSALRSVAVFEYTVWAKTLPASRQTLSTPALSHGRRYLALAAHRSQLTPLFGDGFRLSRNQMKSDPRDFLYRSHRHAP